MKIGDVFSALSAGKLMTRATWETDEFVYLVGGSTFNVSREPLLTVLGPVTVTYRPHIDRRFADGTCGYWTPSHEDAEADDWKLYEHAPEPQPEPAPEPEPAPAPVAEPEPAAEPAAEPVVADVAAPDVAPAPEPVATPAPSAEVEQAPAPAPVDPEPAPVHVAPRARIVWYVQERPKTPVFIPNYWNADAKAFVTDPIGATAYDTMADAIAAASALPVLARVVHYARAV